MTAQTFQQRSRVQGKAIHPTVWRIPSIVFGGLGFVALVAAEYTEQDDWSVLGWVCASTLAYAIAVLYLGFRGGAARVLTDPFLILVGAFSLYFLFGTLLLVIGPEDQANYVLQWYPVTARDAVRVTAMNLIGLATTLLAAGLFINRRIERAVQPIIAFFGKMPIRKVFWLFLIVGVGAKLHVMSVDVAATGDVVVLGTIRTLAGLTQLAILVGILYQGRGEGLIHVFAVALAILDSVIGLFLFNKSAILMPMVVLLLGLYLRRPTVILIVASVVTIATFFLFLANPIGEARSIFASSIDQSVGARLQIVNDVFEPGATSSDGAGSWSRLSYTTSQVAAVDLYERHQGGKDVELLAWAFIPRLLVPDKPIMTRSGVDFNEKVTGSTTSSTGMGLFVSGYHNLGWVGLFLASILAGWILATFAAIARAIVASGSMIMLPVGLLGSYMAFRVDGHFVADYVGPFGMVMVPFLAVLFILRVSGSRNFAGRVR